MNRSPSDLQATGRGNLTSRLLTLAPYAGVDDAAGIALEGAGPLLRAVALGIRADGRHELVWLALAVLTGRFPAPEQALATARALQLSPSGLCHRVFLDAAAGSPDGFARLSMPLDIVENAVVVDVDFCATHMHNTGIQRVVRQTLSRWNRQHDVMMVAWTHPGHSMRTLTHAERSRVVNWTGVDSPEAPSGEPAPRLVVPYNSHVLLPEVPENSYCSPLAALAQYSNNSVAMIGYDAIPVLSADMVPAEESERFGAYLAVVKHSDVVAGISAGSTLEFVGFAEAVGAQGLAGPTVVEVQLPVDTPDKTGDGYSQGSVGRIPSVLCVGSQEPRKNQLAVLFAADILWREGLEFSLTFVGGGSQWFIRTFDAHVRRLRKEGRDVTVRRGILDSDMLDEYRRAKFTVFPSLQEGYGLPVAESLVLGTPVITTNYGSTAEIARDGGCLMVDPRVDSSLADAMRLLLTDTDAYATLVEQIATRPSRSWDDYADELWDALVAGSSPRG